MMDLAKIREVAQMIAADCETDARARVEFTPLGVGTTRGEILAQIQALANLVDALAERLG